MNKSENIDELAKALAEVQARLKPAPFDAVNPYFKSKYASLGSVIDAAKILAEYGLSYSQMPVSDGWTIGVENILMHESGQWISQIILIPMDVESKNPTQEAGKIITYARRYGLASMLGIYSDEDTDGNEPRSEQKQQRSEQKSGPAKPQSARPYSPDELKIRISEIAEGMYPANAKQISLLARKLGEEVPDENVRHKIQKFLFGAESLNDCDPKLVNAGLKWIDLDDGYQMSATAVEELAGVTKLVLGKDRMDEVLANF